MKRCPFCAEEIQDEAVVCRFCNRQIVPGSPVPSALRVGAISAAECGQFGFLLLLPWLIGVAAVYFWVWQSPRMLADSHLGMIAVLTVFASAAFTALDAHQIQAATGTKVYNWSVAAWFFGVLLMALIVAPLYAFKRSKIAGVAGRYGLLVLLAMVVYIGAVGGTGRLLAAPPAVQTQSTANASPAQTSSDDELRRKTISDIMAIVMAINLYGVDKQRFPEASDVVGLAVRLEPKYLEKVPYEDAWGRRFAVRCTEVSYTITSLGRDGFPGGSGVDADLVNKDGVWLE